MKIRFQATFRWWPRAGDIVHLVPTIWISWDRCWPRTARSKPYTLETIISLDWLWWEFCLVVHTGTRGRPPTFESQWGVSREAVERALEATEDPQ